MNKNKKKKAKLIENSVCSFLFLASVKMYLHTCGVIKGSEGCKSSYEPLINYDNYCFGLRRSRAEALLSK